MLRLDKLLNRLPSESFARWMFVSYAVLLLPIYCLPVCTPDEVWFEHDAKMINDASRGLSLLQVIFGQQNHLGYGAIYWLVYSLFARLTAYPLVLMRVVSFLANLSIPFLLLRQCRDEARRPAAICAMLLWLSFTGAWWAGKVTGPELLSMAFAFGGLQLLTKSTQSTKWVTLTLGAGALLGCGVGLKFNSLPMVLCLVFIAPGFTRRWRSLALACLGLAIGFFLANPFALFEPVALLANIRRPGKFGAGYTTQHFAEVMWNTHWEWEGVFRGGYFNWGISPLATPLYFWLLWKCKLPWHWFIGGLVVTSLGVMLYLTSRTYQGWYWLPLLSLFPLTLLQLRKVDAAGWRLAMALVLVNVICNAPWIGMQYYSKFEQFAHRFDHDEVMKEAEAIASRPRDGLLVTILDQGIELHERLGPNSEANSKVVSDLSGFFLLNELRFGLRELKPGETWIVIHDQRLRKFNPIVDATRDAQRLGPEYQVLEEPGDFVTSLRIHRRVFTAKRPQTRR